MSNKVYRKGEVLTVDITDMGVNGEGIGRVDGYTLFVKDALVGDKVKCSIMKAKKGYAYAHLDSIEAPSEYRIDPACQRSRACGGCQLQSLAYEAQAEYKYNNVKNNLIRIGGFDRDFTESISDGMIASKHPLRYRNKAQYPVQRDHKSGEIVTGFYANHSHTVIPVEDCVLGPEEFGSIMKIILDWMRDVNIDAADMDNGIRGIRHVLLRKGFYTGQIMVCLVVSDEHIPEKEKATELVARLNDKVKGLTSVAVSVNPANTNVIMGDTYRTLWGSDTITDKIGDISYKISPLSFFQVNPYQTKRLYDRALEYAALTGDETVWDLYCGIGTISLFLARNAGHVYGIEIVKEAIDDAKENARLNGLTNTTFYTGKAEEVLPGLISGDSSHGGKNADVIVVDPPRKGCDETCLRTMTDIAPDRIVYISCDSATLARDLKYLTGNGYSLVRWSACDMFPMSVHCEAIALLKKSV